MKSHSHLHQPSQRSQATEDDKTCGGLTESLQARQVVLGPPSHVILSRPRLLQQSFNTQRQRNFVHVKKDLQLSQQHEVDVNQKSFHGKKDSRSFSSLGRGSDSNNATTLMLDRTFNRENVQYDRQSQPLSPCPNFIENKKQILQQEQSGELSLNVKKLNANDALRPEQDGAIVSPLGGGSPSFMNRARSMSTNQQRGACAALTKGQIDLLTQKKETSAQNLGAVPIRQSTFKKNNYEYASGGSYLGNNQNLISSASHQTQSAEAAAMAKINFKKGVNTGKNSQSGPKRIGQASAPPEKKPNYDLDHVVIVQGDFNGINSSLQPEQQHLLMKQPQIKSDDLIVVLNVPTEVDTLKMPSPLNPFLDANFHGIYGAGDTQNDDDNHSNYQRLVNGSSAGHRSGSTKRHKKNNYGADTSKVRAQTEVSQEGAHRRSGGKIDGGNLKSQSIVSPQFMNDQIMLLSDNMTIKEQTSHATQETLAQLLAPQMIELKSKIAGQDIRISYNGSAASFRADSQQKLALHDQEQAQTQRVPNESELGGAANDQKSRQLAKWQSSGAGVSKIDGVHNSIMPAFKQIKNGNFRKESVQFSVQPKSNALVTANHPLFMNQIHKLQQQKLIMETKLSKAMKKNSGMWSSNRHSGTANAQNLDSQRMQKIYQNNFSSACSDQNPLDQFQPMEWVEQKSIHQIDPKQLIKQPAQVNARRCTTSFQIKRDSHTAAGFVSQRREIIQNNMIHSTNFNICNENTVNQAVSASFSVNNSQLKDSIKLPFQYKNHQIQVKKKLDGKEQMLLVGEATRRDSNRQATQDNLMDVLTRKKQAYSSQIAKKRHRQATRGRNSLKNPVLSQEETLRMKHNSEDNANPNHPTARGPQSPALSAEKHSNSVESLLPEKGVFKTVKAEVSSKKSRSRQNSSIASRREFIVVPQPGEQSAQQNLMQFPSRLNATIPLVKSQMNSESLRMDTKDKKSDHDDICQLQSPNFRGNALTRSTVDQLELTDVVSTTQKTDVYGAEQLRQGLKTPAEAPSDNCANLLQRVGGDEEGQQNYSDAMFDKFAALRSKTPEHQRRPCQIQQQHQQPQQPAPQVTISIQRKPVVQASGTSACYSNFGEAAGVVQKDARQVDGSEAQSNEIEVVKKQIFYNQQQVSEDIVNKFTDEQLPSEFQRHQTTGGHICHIHRLHSMYKKSRPLSQSFHCKQTRETQKRLQEVLQTANSRIKTAPWAKLVGAQFTSSQRDYKIVPDHYGVFKNGTPQNSSFWMHTTADEKSLDENTMKLDESIISCGGSCPAYTGKSPAGTYTVLSQLKKDMQFKKACKGLIHDSRGLQRVRTLHSYNSATASSKSPTTKVTGVQHPAEIQYKVFRKGTTESTPKQEVTRVRSLNPQQTLRSNLSRKEKEATVGADYQIVMQVPSKRVSTAAGSSSQVASNPNYQQEIRQMRQQKKRELMKARGRSATHSIFSISNVVVQERRGTLQTQNRNEGDYGAFGADGNITECLITDEAPSFQQKRKISTGSRSSQNSSPLDTKFKKNPLKKLPQNTSYSSRLADMTKTLHNSDQIAVQEIIVDQIQPKQEDMGSGGREVIMQKSFTNPINTDFPSPGQRRTIELNQKFVSKIASIAQMDSNEEESAGRIEVLGIIQDLPAPASTNNNQSAETSQLRQTRKAESEFEDDEIGEPSELRTMRLSNESLPHELSIFNSQMHGVGGDQHSGVVTLGNLTKNKLWLKQMQRRNHSGGTADTATCNQSTKHCQQSQFANKAITPGGGSLIKVFLNQTLRQLTARQSCYSTNGFYMNRQTSQQPVKRKAKSGKAQGQHRVQRRQMTVLGRKSDTSQLDPAQSTILRLMPHQERFLNFQVMSQKKQSQICPNEISTTPVSPNQNLIRNRKSNNLSSYAHPMNVQIQRSEETKMVQL